MNNSGAGFPHIRIRGLCKSYLQASRSESLEVLRDITLDIEKGEFVTFFGPNACGKTTLLYVVGGLTPQTKGEVRINGRAPHQTTKGFIFQNYADSLFPWRSNIDNLCFPLEITGLPKRKRRERARQFLSKLGVKLPLEGFPYELSGGQQQLLAIVRALIYDPEVVLMDEPFGSLDYQTRLSMQITLLDLWSKTGKTVVFVSHEIDEAIFLADRLVLLSNKPTRIMDILKVDLPRPRSHEIVESHEFVRLKTQALRIFKQAVYE